MKKYTIQHRKHILFLSLVLIFTIAFSTQAYSHPGRLDKNCGHYNRKTGQYHYHPERCEKGESHRGEILFGRVVQVKDGDTIVISPEKGGQFFICRLYGIDAPETTHGNSPGQPFGHEAKKYLKSLILGKTVMVKTTGKKTYGREICHIEYQGVDINLEMIKAGYAWAYRYYLKQPYKAVYINAEKQARKKKLGLWSQEKPVPPWKFRKHN